MTADELSAALETAEAVSAGLDAIARVLARRGQTSGRREVLRKLPSALREEATPMQRPSGPSPRTGAEALIQSLTIFSTCSSSRTPVSSRRSVRLTPTRSRPPR